MSLSTDQVSGARRHWSKKSKRLSHWYKNQTARKARRVPVDQVPGKVIKGWAD